MNDTRLLYVQILANDVVTMTHAVIVPTQHDESIQAQIALETCLSELSKSTTCVPERCVVRSLQDAVIMPATTYACAACEGTYIGRIHSWTDWIKNNVKPLTSCGRR